MSYLNFAYRSLMSYLDSFNENTFETLSGPALTVKRDKLLNLWNKYDTLCDAEIEKLGPTHEDAQNCHRLHDETYLRYEECLMALHTIEANDRQSTQQFPEFNNSTNINHTFSSFRTPTCDVEIFSGDFTKWPKFRDLFTAIYIDRSDLKPVEKLYHLFDKTSGEARKEIEHVELSNDNFVAAWELLRQRYENERCLTNYEVNKLLTLPYVRHETAADLGQLYRTAKSSLYSLQRLGHHVEHWDPLFIPLFLKRLPMRTKDLWEMSLPDNRKTPTWTHLAEFLQKRLRSLEAVNSECTFETSAASVSIPKTPRHSNTKAFSTITSFAKCVLCQITHPLRQCPKFQSLNPQQRRAVVTEQKLCENCFARTHTLNRCHSQSRCMLCFQKHHTMLHSVNSPTSSRSKSHLTTTPPSPPVSLAPASTNASTNVPATTTHSFFISPDKEVSQQSCHTNVLLGTATVIVQIGEAKRTLRALIDPGSQATFIAQWVVRSLHMPSKEVKIDVSGISDTVMTTSIRECSFQLRSPIRPEFVMEVRALSLKTLTDFLPSARHDPAILAEYKHLPIADTFHTKERIDMVIGADVYPTILCSGVRHHSSHNLIAQESVFGWIFTGLSPESPKREHISAFCSKVSLDRRLARFWELEEPPKRRILSSEEQYAEQFYQDTTIRRHDGRYEVQLPFRSGVLNERDLGDSRRFAYAQYQSHERRLAKKLPFKETYDEILHEYLNLGHMASLPRQIAEQRTHNGTTYYLPHHAVLKEQSSTTKVRIVFNASAPASSGISLNDLLLPGPALQRELPLLITAWRKWKYVFTADIEKMYRQIWIHPSHRPFQRILFRPSAEDEIQDYELNTVTFGVNCAPFLAIRTLHQLANDTEAQFPNAASIIRNGMYVDDVLAGGHTLSSTISSKVEIDQVLRSAGFKLHKWCANSIDLLSPTERSKSAEDQVLELKLEESHTALGLRWRPQSDEFYFVFTKLNETRSPLTKRVIVSEASKLFDPLGWLAPITMQAKLIIQQIWRDKTDWDEPILPRTEHYWHQYRACYATIPLIRIPRWLHYGPNEQMELCGFCDASEKAYAANVYSRILSPDGVMTTQLLVSKTRVAPLNPKSLPRLELCGAELLSKIIDTFRQELNISWDNVYLWTDSTIVLSWLRKPPIHWTTFVANRVASIIDTGCGDRWRHVSSTDNPADLATRPIPILDLNHNTLWWHGPNWLQMTTDLWPVSTPNFDKASLTEIKPVRVLSTIKNSNEEFLHRFSTFHRALRVLCYVRRFARIRRKDRPIPWTSTDLTHEEIIDAQNTLIRCCQRLYYDKEYQYLMLEKRSPPFGSLQRFHLFLDANKIIRCNGRLVNSNILSNDEKQPILLPYSSRYALLLMRYIHQITIHGGPLLMLRTVRSLYWIPRGRRLAQHIARQCKSCVIHTQQAAKQLMSALPQSRTTLVRAFHTTGVDFAGPFNLKQTTGRGYRTRKGYVALFVCFATKAIHMEVTSDLSTPTFRAAFDRFIARRGCPACIWSDNGTTFVGAERSFLTEQRLLISQIRRQLVADHILQGLEWRFIPPGAPHMGGLWEAGVKSFKRHLNRLNAENYTFEEFTTILSQIEACLNSRPLCALNDDLNTIDALTPGHFLIGGPILAPPTSQSGDDCISLRNRFQRLKNQIQHFAQRWKEEYLLELHRRTKWKCIQRSFQIGDLVVIRKELLPPHQWQIGRIIQTHPGPDSLVRVVDIKTPTGTLRRPITRLVLLPNDDNTSFPLYKT